MKFYTLGLNHSHASVRLTDAFALDADQQRALYDDLILSEDAEVVVLSTCNRTEAFLYGRDADVRRLEAGLSEVADHPWPHEAAFRWSDEAAVRHVLHVTAGLNSMVVGDQQILAQVKEAYRRAVDAGQVHSLMHRLMHTAFRAAKRVSSETDLSSGAASVSTAAIEMARQYFAEQTSVPSLSEVKVLLVGAGKMGRLALTSLKEDAPASIAITNRSPDRARELADAHGGTVVPWAQRYDALTDVDLALVATGAPDPIIRAPSLPPNPGGDRLIVDIARPRNVDPNVSERPGYSVYDLDDLQAWTQRVQEERSTSIPEAEAICDDLLSDFVTWVFHQQALQPAIQAIRETFDTIREQEVDRHAHRTDMDREEVDRLTESIMQKLLAVPIVRLKNVDPDSIDFVQGIKLLHALFAPSDDSQGRSLQEAAPGGDQPSLSDAPSRCPYLTHDLDEDQAADELHDVLQLTEEPASRSSE
jgi:glutamyl-tRNA reductase